tara:strand:- start:140358 stop:141170 length:813 start_codon:yes stop_codon:yes gene_type:complete
LKKHLPLIIVSLLFSGVALTAESKTVPFNDITWGHLNPLRGSASPDAADLWGDRTSASPTGFIVKFKDGFSSPPHIHNVSYRGIVISGSVHNDDPAAKSMWLTPGSFWTQPAGEAHITAAEGESNIAYIEIDSGPYLVQPESEAFDNGERPVNIEGSNLVWLDAADIKWVGENTHVKRAFLWGNTQQGSLNGSLIKLPANFNGKITSEGDTFHAVVVAGEVQYSKAGSTQLLDAGSYFGSSENKSYSLNTTDESTLYIRTNGKFNINKQI